MIDKKKIKFEKHIYSNKLFELILYIIIVYLALIMPFMQLQMILLNKVLIRGMHLQVFILFLTLLYVGVGIYEGKKIVKDKLSVISILFILFIGLDSFFVFVTLSYKIGYIGYVLNTQFFIFLSIVVLVFPPEIKLEKLKKFLYLLYVIAFINIVVAFIQHLFNTRIFPFAKDNAGNILIQFDTFNLSGLVRATGTFSSGLKLGIFMLFILSIHIIKFYNSYKKVSFRVKVINIVFILSLLLSIYFTYTRNVYFLTLYIFIYLAIFKFLNNKIKDLVLNIYPLAIPIIYILGLFVVVPIISKIFNNTMFSSQSFLTRVYFWKNQLVDIKSWKISNILFGKFIVQIQNPKSKLYNVPELILDNIYLNYISFIGIIGLVFFLLIIWMLYRKIYKLAYKKSALIVLAAFISAIYTIGTLNLLEDIYILISLFFPSMFIREFLLPEDENTH